MAKFTAGIIDLDELYKFAKDNPGCYFRPRSPEAARTMRKYAKLCGDLTSSIPSESGVYLWGYYDARGLWKNVYLGLAGFGKVSHLQARINE